MVCVLNVLYDERFGGPQFRVLQVAQGLSRRGFRTLVAIPNGDQTFANELRGAGIDFVEFPLVRLRQTLNPLVHLQFLVRFWPNVQKLRAIIREHNIQIVHTNSLRHLQGAIAARLERVALVWHLNDTSTPLPLRWMILPLVRRWADVIPVAAGSLTRHYFPQTRSVQDRLHILYPPVDPHRFDDADARKSLRSELAIPLNCPLICTIGSLNPGKGIEFLLEAAPAIRRMYPDARFIAVGGMGGNRPKYRERLLKRRSELRLDEVFLFIGHRADVPRILLASDLYVHPSESEACPMAVLEACACGRPVVATRVGGTPELIVDNETGILIDPGSPRQIEEAVLRLLSNPDRARRMGTAGARRVRQAFSLQRCVEEHIQIYHAALAAN